MKKSTLIIAVVLIFIIILFLMIFKDKKKPLSDEKWHEFKNLDYFIKKNIPRYNAYQLLYPKKSPTNIIVEVNIGLDNPFYTNTKKSIDLNAPYILVNKYNYLEEDYIPKNLENINNKVKLVDYAAKAFQDMVTKASRENYQINGFSGYRSYNYQANLYNKYSSIDGQEKADTYSARAGYSEHQTGLAIDVSNSTLPYTEFEKTKEYQWMQENAHKYGFILRYPKEKENITGYTYESWHYRYVGPDIATYIKNNNITFDEYYTMFIAKN